MMHQLRLPVQAYRRLSSFEPRLSLLVANLSCRSYSQTPNLASKPLPPRLKINDADLTISYLKGTGPGGQKINKTNSAVQISHAPSGIVVKCQATRSRSQNEKIARSLLADKVESQEKGDQSRVALKAAAARKKKASKLKKARRKYRQLEENENGIEDTEGEHASDEDGLEQDIEDAPSHGETNINAPSPTNSTTKYTDTGSGGQNAP
ncbi:peptide chain release factor-like protein [Penicillium diatomitis]|uniref:Peptide chain release factor-like protein n=1 Tax=Penicillium diatomitis TaxID=2819901 RepID=A0A9W9X5X7_9EURO|nr:peptide chain release factor-like protein [Penicillium diatomitis]KAJ5484928.1 peptide chain release factor-like protein [Penicillium diatomitis]